MKNSHTPLVDLLLGVYDLLAVDDAAAQHAAKLQGFAREATIAAGRSDGYAQCALEEIQRRAKYYDSHPRAFDCGNAIAAIRKAMRRMEKTNGLPCQAARDCRQEKERAYAKDADAAREAAFGCPSDRKNAEGA